VPAVEDEPYLVAADRDGLCREAIAERILVAGCDNQAGGSCRRPSHPPFPGFCSRSSGGRVSHFSLADFMSGSSP
jgi:hypothetical protein